MGRDERRTGRVSAPLLAVPALLGLALLVVPLAALVRASSGAPCGRTSPRRSAVGTRALARTGLVATAVCVVLGVPLALVIARSTGRTAALLRVLVTVPLVLPPMVGGVAMLFLFGRTSGLGGILEEWGIRIPFTTTAVMLAQTFVALPFLVLALEGALRTTGMGFEQAAAGLGAGRWTILARVTLPLAAPGLVAGIVLCFARAIGEFGATALFAGNAPGVTQTMPLAIYTAFNGAGVVREPRSRSRCCCS